MSVKITVKNNSAIRIEGEFELFDGNGNKFDLGERTVISLCRCGLSAIKPFCDGAHKAAGFSSEVTTSTLPAPPKTNPV